MATTTTISTMDRPVKKPTFQSTSPSRKVKNNIATAAFMVCFGIALVPLVWVLFTVIERGYSALISVDWWTHSMKGVLPEDFGGGVYHAIYGTFVQAGIAALISVPLGIMCGIYLVEYGRGRFAKVTTFTVDVLAGVPSIVAAMFVFAAWIATMGFGRSGLAVSFALVLLMLPVVVRSTEEMLKLVPDSLREASYALGIPKWKTIVKVVLPTAISGIISGVLMATARVMGETAPVLVLVGYSKSINFDIFDGNMASLPLLIFTERANSEAAGDLRIWGTALTLILLIAALSGLAALASRLLAPKTR
ncbi:MAG: phosphate ABC transporter permease PstA [Nocardiaceae bacterium]|nr:phosphate ABC transporter permease PstA [Nocardiaceae bacterium]